MESYGQSIGDKFEHSDLEIPKSQETGIVNTREVNKENYENQEDFGSDDSNLDLLTIKNMRHRTASHGGLPRNKDDLPTETEFEAGTELKRKSRKRKRDETTWKRNVKKEKRNAGKSYESEKGNLIRERHVRGTCNEKCRHKCHMNFTTEERKECFKLFSGIRDNDRKRHFISANVTTINDPKYRYIKENSTRSKNQAYFLPKGDQRMRVCKKFFMCTLDIGDTMIRTTLKKSNPVASWNPKNEANMGTRKSWIQVCGKV